MTDQKLPGQGPGTTGPGPDGAGFTYQGAEPELIVVARAEARLRADTQGVRSASGADISALNMFLSDEQLALEPVFGSEERTRSALPPQPEGPAGGGRGTLPDLSLFYRVRGGGDRTEELTARLAALPEIETAYLKPGAVPARTAPHGAPAKAQPEEAKRLKEGAPATPDFTGRQGYLAPAPEGVDAYWAWQRPGGSGQHVTVVDVEGAWQLGHEDLAEKLAGIVVGNPVQDIAWRNHGTAVLGVIGGDRDEKGITGIAPEAVTAAASFQGIGSAAAIHAAAERLSHGDLLLIELHRPGPRFDFEVRDDQRGYIAVEWWPDDFAAIRWATSKGVLVVEAAGNGGESLDDAVYERRPDAFPEWWRNPFNPSNQPSGAVLVGAGAPRPGRTAAITVPTARGLRSPTTARGWTPRAGAARSPRPAASGTGRVTCRAARRRSPGTRTPSPAPPRPRRWWPAPWRRCRASSRPRTLRRWARRRPVRRCAGPVRRSRTLRAARLAADRQPPRHQGGGHPAGAVVGRLGTGGAVLGRTDAVPP